MQQAEWTANPPDYARKARSIRRTAAIVQNPDARRQLLFLAALFEKLMDFGDLRVDVPPGSH